MNRSAVRGLLAAADQVEARIVEAEKLRAALEEIRRLHQPMMFPAGADLQRWVKVCGHCCFGEATGQQSDDCAVFHEHAADGPGCATAEIIARAGL